MMTGEQKLAEVELALDGISLAEAREAFHFAAEASWRKFAPIFRGIDDRYDRAIECGEFFEQKIIASLGESLGVALIRKINLEKYKKMGEWFCQRCKVTPEEWQIFHRGTLGERHDLRRRLRLAAQAGKFWNDGEDDDDDLDLRADHGA